MPSTTELQQLARHMEWADSLIWKAVRASEAASADSRTRLWLYHVHVVQRAFPLMWRSEKLELPEPGELEDLPALAAWGREGHEVLRAFLAGAAPEALAREIHVPWVGEAAKAADRPLVHPSLEQTALQVVLHSTHHRGQLAARIRELGGSPPITDFIAWIWWGQPAAEW